MDRIERGLEPTDDELAAREADAAAAEAAAIGGPAPSDGADEAAQPVIESGGATRRASSLRRRS